MDAELEWLQIRKQVLKLLSSEELVKKLKAVPSTEELAKKLGMNQVGAEICSWQNDGAVPDKGAQSYPANGFDPLSDFREERAIAATLRSALDAARPGRVVYLSTIGAVTRWKLRSSSSRETGGDHECHVAAE